MAMIIKEIKYNGFTETPSDYECPDGDLATVSGLVPEDDGMRAVQMPKTLFGLPLAYLPNYYTVCHIHENTGYKHYIIRRHIESSGTVTDTFYWINLPSSNIRFSASDFNGTGSNGVTKIQEFTNKTIYDIKSIGNALVILTEDGMYYHLWKGDSYKNLGTHMPEPQLSFGLRGKADGKVSELSEKEWNITQSVWDAEKTASAISSFPAEYTFMTEDFIKAYTDSAMAQINAFIANKSVEEGKFLFPFFVRYAYRLFDESLVMQSCPVLMITDTHPIHLHQSKDLGDGFYTLCVSMLFDLDYKANLPSGITSFSDYLGDWKEIIKSVEIFISEPIYTFNPSGKIKGWAIANGYTECGYGVFNIQSYDDVYHEASFADPTNTTAYSKYYTTLATYPDGATFGPTTLDGLYWGATDEVTLPNYSNEEMAEKIKSVHNFYLFKSIPVDKVESASRTILSMPESFLTGLTGREVMTDDYQSHDLLIPQCAFTYNSRLTIGNIARHISNPFWASSMFYHSYHSMGDLGRTDLVPATDAQYEVYVYLKIDNKDIVVKGTQSSMGYYNPFQYFYYPNPNAYKAIIKKVYNDLGVTTTQYWELPLTQHDFLNGAVYFEGFDYAHTHHNTPPQVTTDNKVYIPNKIYTSEINNPFVFNKEGIQTIGIGTVLGLRPAIKEMSPSQYGQYDFYVFTTDGVWVLKVSSTGYLESPSLVTPDIVNGKGESITQIEEAVLFATKRGVMMVSGSKSVCMSDTINSKRPFVPFGTTAADDVLPKFRNVLNTPRYADLLYDTKLVPFLEFVRDCRMQYDYTHQHIIVFNPSQPYAYVYSLKSKQWGLIPSLMNMPVFDYPAAVVVEYTNESYWNVVDYAYEPTIYDQEHQLDPGVYQGLVITRPLKLDMPDVLKTVTTVIQRGMFEKGHVYGALYGSRDLQNWHLVWSSVDHYIRGMHGTPYKYFRLALICDLTAKENLFGCSIGVIPRDTNNLR